MIVNEAALTLGERLIANREAVEKAKAREAEEAQEHRNLFVREKLTWIWQYFVDRIESGQVPKPCEIGTDWFDKPQFWDDLSKEMFEPSMDDDRYVGQVTNRDIRSPSNPYHPAWCDFVKWCLAESLIPKVARVKYNTRWGYEISLEPGIKK